MLKNEYSPISVYSEIGRLKTVLVKRPSIEIDYITPNTVDELLFSALLDFHQAQKEHDEFVKILKDNGVEVLYLDDLVLETFNAVNFTIQNKFIDMWIKEDGVKNTKLNQLIKHYLQSLSIRGMIEKMFSGILAKDLGIEYKEEIVVKPMPNLYFTRDPFACVGNGVTLHHMKYEVRRRETLFGWFIFNYHPKYKNVSKYYERDAKETIEGGDIFIYNEKTLVIGVSERTTLNAIMELAVNIKHDHQTKFERIIAINVPKKTNLMHLDTWLTMIDTNKFIYSPNMIKDLKIWEIDLKAKKLKPKQYSEGLEKLLESIINDKPILIPVGGNKSQMRVDIETHFDATNFLTIRPGVVVGYDRNRDTIAALKEAGVEVLTFGGNQLSLGMGSSRCMSMPFYREPVKK